MKVLGCKSLVFVVGSTLLLNSACGKKSDSSSDSSVAESQSPSTAYPTGFALAVLPTSTGASLTADEKEQSVAQKNAEAESLLSGESASCLPAVHAKDLASAGSETCYEFDQDMIYGGMSKQGSSTIESYLGTKNGKSSSGEACLASFTRAQVKDVTAMVDQTLGFVAAGICQYKKDNAGGTLPAAAGEEIDIAASLKTVFGDKVGSISKAVIKRLGDVEERAVYMTKIGLTDRNGLERKMKILHSPSKDGTNKTYNGSIALVMNGDLRDKAPKTGANDKHRLLSVTYAKTSDTAVKFELRTAQVHKDLVAKSLSDANVLDFNTGTKFSETAKTVDYGKYYKADGSAFAQANEAVDGMTYIAFDMNKDTGEGTLSYWKNPGGSYYENARGFNVSVAKNSSGVMEGCAVSGAASTDFGNGTSIRRFLKEGGDLSLQAKGFWHPFFSSNAAGFAETTASGETFFTSSSSSPVQAAKWFQPAISNTTLAAKFVKDQQGSIITRQCFKQNTTTGIYEIDTSKTTDAAGFELIDSGSATSKDKLIAPPSIGDAKAPAVAAGSTALLDL